jgi:hypothetical protein
MVCVKMMSCVLRRYNHFSFCCKVGMLLLRVLTRFYWYYIITGATEVWEVNEVIRGLP